VCLWRFRLVLWWRRMLLGRCGATPVPYSERGQSALWPALGIGTVTDLAG
jgi:hypothetical protein